MPHKTLQTYILFNPGTKLGAGAGDSQIHQVPSPLPPNSFGEDADDVPVAAKFYTPPNHDMERTFAEH